MTKIERGEQMILIANERVTCTFICEDSARYFRGILPGETEDDFHSFRVDHWRRAQEPMPEVHLNTVVRLSATGRLCFFGDLVFDRSSPLKREEALAMVGVIYGPVVWERESHA